MAACFVDAIASGAPRRRQTHAPLPPAERIEKVLMNVLNSPAKRAGRNGGWGWRPLVRRAFVGLSEPSGAIMSSFRRTRPRTNPLRCGRGGRPAWGSAVGERPIGRIVSIPATIFYIKSSRRSVHRQEEQRLEGLPTSFQPICPARIDERA